MNGVYEVGDIVLDKWKLVREIGSGSCGRVYEAEREEFGVVYKSAIKIITLTQSEKSIALACSSGMDLANTAEGKNLHRFVGELSQEFAQMDHLKGHSNIVGVEDHAVIPHEEGKGWDILIRTELLTSLEEHTRQRIMPKSEVIRLGEDMCSALESSRKFQIVHGNIKPNNIFVSNLGDFKLGDYGIFSAVEKTIGDICPKDVYTSPEQFLDEDIDANPDIYSLGMVLYCLLNRGRGPFLPDYPQTVTYADKDQAQKKRLAGEPLPPPLEADPILTEVILKACAHRPEDRYQSAEEFRLALKAAEQGIRLKDEKADFAADEKTESKIVEAEQTDVSEHDNAEQPLEVRKKKKNYFLLAILAMAIALPMAIVPFAIRYMGMRTEIGQSGTSATNLIMPEIASASVQNADEVKLEPLAQIIPSMIWGEYIFNNFTKTDSGNHSVNLPAFMENMEYETYGDMEYSVLPYRIKKSESFVGQKAKPELEQLQKEIETKFGESGWNRYLSYMEYSLVSFEFCDRYGSSWTREGVGKIEDGKLMVCFDYSVDKDTMNVNCPTWTEYDFTVHDGKLILQRGGKAVELMPRDLANDMRASNRLISMHGYIAQPEQAYQDIAKIYFSVEGEESHCNIDFTDGGYANDPVFTWQEPNHIKISWTKAYRFYNGRMTTIPEEQSIEADCIFSGSQGLILLVDGKYYPYQTPGEVYKANKDSELQQNAAA